MEVKDWILLIIPIIFNGVIVLIIQIIFENKKLKREVKFPYYQNLSKLLKEVNATFIQENIDVQIKKRDVNETIIFLENSIVEIIKYYDSNQLYLSKIRPEYQLLLHSWDSFINAAKMVSNPLTEIDKMELGVKVQDIKNNLNKLILSLDNLMLKI